jgi:hypothetical protein
LSDILGPTDYAKLKKKIAEALREELTSGDVMLSVILKDSNSDELSANIRNLDVLLSSRASEATLSALNTEVVNNTWQKMRYGRVLSSLAWVYSSVVTAPAAVTTLASYTVPAGKTGFIYGYFISASEANQFEIRWASGGVTRAIRVVFGGGGSVHAASLIALNEGLPADPGTTISIVNINAGGAGDVYQAGLLIGLP